MAILFKRFAHAENKNQTQCLCTRVGRLLLHACEMLLFAAYLVW